MEIAIAGALISAIFGPLLKKLIDVTLKKLKELRKASRTLKILETTILKAQMEFQNVDTFLLEGRFQSVVLDRIGTLTLLCYEAEDLMEDIALMIIKKSPWKWVKKSGVSKLQKKLNEIVDQLNKLVNVMSRHKQELKQPVWGDLAISLIGRDDDINDIIEELISCPNNNNGVCIVGMSGIGKTALSVSILKDARISQEFQILKVDVPNGIFRCEETINELVKYTEKGSLTEKPMLIMFDNLLDVQDLEWANFLSKVKGPESKIRSTKILITTLNPRVSEISLTTARNLNPLSDGDIKQVIEQNAQFHNADLQISLLTNAETLAKDCEGHPGVASYLGYFLATCEKERRATTFDLWDLPELQKAIFPILSLSYANMRPHLRRCLAYFALFPHEHGYNVDDLIQLWAGEGFIHQVEGKWTSEQADKNLVNDLLQRSVLQPSDGAIDNAQKQPIYKLHKFNHIFSKAAGSSICLQLRKPGCINNARHLSLLCDIDEPLCKILIKGKSLRTLYSLHNPITGVKVRIPATLFKALKYLRVLVLYRTNIDNIPDSVDELEHLRFLDISYTLIQTLPAKLCELHNLQFLKIKETKLRQLPKAFEKLTNLRYVDWEIRDIRRMSSLPKNIGALSHLETLPLFRVSELVQYSLKQLMNMSSLQGSIFITHLENVKSEANAQEAKLCEKPNLKKIALEWTKNSSVSQENSLVSKEVLTGLEPHNNLRELKITNYNNRLFPEWMSHSTRILENIHLYNCPSCRVLPPLGELQHLKTLILEEFLILKSVDGLFVAHTPIIFKSLESLTFKSLTEIQECSALESNDLPSLRILEIIDCPKLTNLSTLEHLTSLEDLHIEGCTTLQSLPDLPVSLKSLIIRNCELLKNRCQTGGEDWQKVDRILEVEIDNEEVTTSAASSDGLAPRDQQINGN